MTLIYVCGCIMQTNGLANQSSAKRDSEDWGGWMIKTYLKRDPINRADRQRDYNWHPVSVSGLHRQSPLTLSTTPAIADRLVRCFRFSTQHNPTRSGEIFGSTAICFKSPGLLHANTADINIIRAEYHQNRWFTKRREGLPINYLRSSTYLVYVITVVNNE